MGFLALAAGFALFFILLRLLERNRELRAFWLGRVAVGALLGVVLDRLAPLWTRLDDVIGNPLILLTADNSLAGLVGGLFAFAGVCLASLLQLSRTKVPPARWKLLTPVAAGLLLAGGLFWLAPHALDGPPELHVSVPDLEGRKHTLAEWKGKVAVLNFWATWCPPCVAELPEFKSFVAEGSKDVVLVGINAVATEKAGVSGVLKFASENKTTWTQLTDPDGELQKHYAVSALPTTVVLDGKGRVIARHEGAVDLAWLKSLEALAR